MVVMEEIAVARGMCNVHAAELHLLEMRMWLWTQGIHLPKFQNTCHHCANFFQPIDEIQSSKCMDLWFF